LYRELIGGMLKKYGRECVIVPENGDEVVRVMAIINPYTYKQRMYLNDVYLPDGVIDKGIFNYIGDPEVSLDNYSLGSIIKCGTNRYTIMRTEQYFMENTAIYTWAVLQLQRKVGVNVQHTD